LSKHKRGVAYKWLVMSVVAMGTLITTIDMGGIRVILPHLEQVFQSSPNVVVWVSLIWVLVGSSLMLSMGRAADIFGRKRLYTFGFAIFLLGLVLCALSRNVVQLIIFRFIQSIGAGMTIAIGMAILTPSFPSNERGKALGIIGAIAGLGLLSGPALGGLCLDLFGWRSFFYIRVPISAIGLVMVRILLKKEPAQEGKEKFDIPGAMTFFFALICLLLVLTQGERMGWGSPWILILSCLGILLLVSFLIVENRIAQPVLDLKIFRNRLFSIAVISHILLYVSHTAVNFAIPFYLIDGIGLSASKAGLLLITIPAIVLLLSPVSGRLSDKLGTLVLCALGFVLTAVGLFLLGRATIDTSIGSIIFYLILMGVGVGLFETPNTSAIIGAVHSERLGSASAMVGTLRHLGMSIGLAFSGSVFTASRFSHSAQLAAQKVPRDMVDKLSTVSGYQDTLIIALIVAIIGLLTTVFRGRIAQKCR
jgi:EmrB/QacA subfamily drug resistance transporter